MSNEIEIGDIKIWRDNNGDLWLGNEDGEAMQCNAETYSALVSLIEQFWKEKF